MREKSLLLAPKVDRATKGQRESARDDIGRTRIFQQWSGREANSGGSSLETSTRKWQPVMIVFLRGSLDPGRVSTQLLHTSSLQMEDLSWEEEERPVIILRRNVIEICPCSL